MAASADGIPMSPATADRTPTPPRGIGVYWLLLLRYEYLLAWRSRPGRATLVLCLVAGLIAGGSSGLGPALAAYRAWRLGSLMLGFAALGLVALAARRDDLALAADGVDSRPQSATDRLAARFVGTFLFVMLSYAVLVAATCLTQLALGGPLPEGAGSRLSLAAPLAAFSDGLTSLFYLSALGYLVSTLFPHVLSVAVVALYWVLILLGRDFVSRVFDFSLTQNARPYLLLSLALVLLAMQVAAWRARVGRRWRPALSLPALLLVAWGLSAAGHLVQARHDPPFHAKPQAILMASQDIRLGTLPGFWLPDQRGRRTGLQDLAGGPLVVAFWSPMVQESATILTVCQRLHTQYAGRGLRVVAICLADDWSVARRVARQRGYSFPMLTDPGCHWTETIDSCSPLAEAYTVTSLPAIFVADRDRRVRYEGVIGMSQTSWAGFQKRAEDVLAGTPGGGGTGG